MAKRVEFAGASLSLKTDKFKKSMSDLKKESKSLSQSFKGMFAPLLAGIGIVASINKIKNSMVELEDTVRKFSTLTGDSTSARAYFDDLNNLSREIRPNFEEITASAMVLNSKGLKPSVETIRSLSAIALGTGRTLEQVSSTFANASQGQLKSLKQLGIIAKDNGNTLSMTFKGQTVEIGKSKEAMEEYIQNLTKTNFKDLLSNQNTGLGGALKILGEAWGDFWRGVAESGAGKVLEDIIRKTASFIDDITEFVSTPEFANFFKDTIDGFVSLWSIISGAATKFFDWFAKALGNEEVDWIRFFGNFWQFLKRGWSTLWTTVVNFAEKASAEIIGRFNGVTAFINEFSKEGSLTNAMEAYSAALDLAQSNAELHSNLRLQQLFKETKELDKLIAKREADAKAEKKRREQLKRDGYSFTPVGDTGSSGGSSGSGRVKQTVDSMLTEWKSYFEKLNNLWIEQNLSESQKENLRYQNELDKLNNFLAQGYASEQEYLLSLEILEKEHQDKINQIKKDAYEEYKKDVEEKQKNKKSFIGMSDDDFQSTLDALNDTSNAFGNLTEKMNENSTAYKALFAVEKSFQVASTMLSCINAWAKALDDNTSVSWVQRIANYASAVALTSTIMSQIGSVAMHDKGGRLTGLDIVGEKGPELLIGQSGNVIGRKQTEDLLSNRGDNNITVNLIEDSARAGKVEKKTTDEETIINVCVSNIYKGGELAESISSVYGLARQGI